MAQTWDMQWAKLGLSYVKYARRDNLPTRSVAAVVIIIIAAVCFRTSFLLVVLLYFQKVASHSKFMWYETLRGLLHGPNLLEETMSECLLL